MLKVLDMLSEGGSPDKPNEDLIFSSTDCAAVLDGATNLNNSDYGAHEFVHDFIEKFAPLIKHMALPQAICSAIADLYRSKIGDKPMPNDIALYSSASAAFVVETDTSLLFLTLGDCTALVFTDDGVKKVHDNALDRLDETVITRLKQLHEQTGKDVVEILKTIEIKTMLVENRKKMNTADGYKSLSFNINQLTDDDVTVFDKTKVQKIILYSDGFKNMEREILQGMPINKLYKKLRQQEIADSHLNKTPRFKISDDASIVRIIIE